MAFVKVGKTSMVKPKSGRLFIINGIDIAVFNVNNKFYAIQNKCPHQGVGLSTGYLEDNIVVCPGHGWRFNIETGENEFMPVHVRRFNTKVEGDDLLIEI